MKFGHTLEHDFRHFLSDFEENLLGRFRENKMAAKNFKNFFRTEADQLTLPNLVG
jgi:hypothetical protein